MQNQGRSPIQDGYYSVVYPTGAYRTLRFRTAKAGFFQGRQVLAFKEMGEYVGCGTVNPNGSIWFWKRFTSINPIERLARIRYAVRKIIEAPNEYQVAFALKEGRCARCGRKLTVPASLSFGLGPECAGRKHWNKGDNRAAFARLREAAERDGRSNPAQPEARA
jgi:hypothetical protein